MIRIHTGLCLLCIALTSVICMRCEVIQPLKSDDAAPEISGLTIPETLYLRSEALYSIRVRAMDPQGPDDIAAVAYRVLAEDGGEPLLESEMRDDGRDGDIVPRDGVFFDTLSVSFAGRRPGQYPIEVFAVDGSGNTSTTLIDTMVVVDAEMNLPPFIVSAVLEDTLTSSTLEDVFISLDVGDPQGLADIDSVSLQIYAPFSPSPAFVARLSDDGIDGDVAAGDGTFSFREDLSDSLTRAGDHAIRFQATDRGGLASEAVVMGFYVKIINDPPVLSDLTAPDTVSRSSTGSFLLAVRADDPQGLDDIAGVFFNTTKPDGNPSSGNPFQMKDDGSDGDAVPGDGIFSLMVTITPQNDTGAYRFDFFAKDRLEAFSDTLTHTITVIE